MPDDTHDLPPTRHDLPLTRSAPRPLTGTSIGVVALTVVVTAALLVIDPPYVAPGQLMLWASTAVLTQLGAMVAVGAISRGQTDVEPLDISRPAMIRPSTHVVTAVGAVVGVLCLVEALLIARAGFFGQTHAAIDQIALLWTAAILTVAYILISSEPPAPATKIGPTRWVAIVSVLTLISSVTLLAYRRWLDHSPFPPDAIHANVSVAIVDYEHTAAARTALGIDGIEGIVTYGNDRTIVGRLDYDAPSAQQGGRYNIVLIDTRTNRMAPLMFGLNGAGWDSVLESVSRQYPWLSAMAPREPDVTDDRLAITASPGQAGPVGFVAQFPGAGAIAGNHLVVVIIFIGSRGQVYWATPVPVREIAV